MANIIKSTKDVWYNRDDTLERIGSNLTGTPGQEYTYTVGHTSSGKFKLRCNHMDEPRCGQIRLPNTDKKLRALESEIITEINSYRRKFGIAYLVKWNNFTKPQKDIGILRYAFARLHYKVLCREYDIKCYAKSRWNTHNATSVAVKFAANGCTDNYVFNTFMDYKRQVEQYRVVRQRDKAHADALLEYAERKAEADRVPNRWSILDIRKDDE